MNQSEEKLFTLMAHADDLQGIANKSLQAVNGAVKRLENDSANAIVSSIRAGIDTTLADTKKELLDATVGLVGASSEAKTTCALLKSTGLFQGVFLLAVGIVTSAIAIAGIWWGTSSLRDEAAELRSTIAILRQHAAEERRTLQELEGKTWGLELLKIDGKRWIRFKKGDEPGTMGTWENGKRHGIEVKP